MGGETVLFRHDKKFINPCVLALNVKDDLSDVSDRVRDIAHRGGNYHNHVLDAGQWKEAVQGYLA